MTADLETSALRDFVAENESHSNPMYRGSEWTPYNIEMIEKWIELRNGLTFVDDYVDGDWYALDIKTRHSRYGTNYIFIEPNKKLWRIRETASEFYGKVVLWPQEK